MLDSKSWRVSLFKLFCIALSIWTTTAQFLKRVESSAPSEVSHPLRILQDEIDERINGLVQRGPPNGSLFTWDAIVNEPSDTIFNATFASLVNDYNNPEKCKFTDWQRNTLTLMQQVMQFWSDLAKKEKIPYLLSFGSLLGYARNKSYSPYDADMDILLPSWAYDRLMKYITPLPLEPRMKKLFLFLHPEFRHVALSERRRFSCAGHAVDEYEGLCSFAGNMGRISLQHRHLDLFALDHLPHHNLAVVSKDEILLSKPEVFFPPRPCTFFGVQLFCPNDYIKLLRAWYGPKTELLRPEKLCIDEQWQISSENPEVHASLLKSWKDRVGPIAAAETDDVKGLWRPIYDVKKFCDKLDPPIDYLQNGICNFSKKKS